MWSSEEVTQASNHTTAALNWNVLHTEPDLWFPWLMITSLFIKLILTDSSAEIVMLARRTPSESRIESRNAVMRNDSLQLERQQVARAEIRIFLSSQIVSNCILNLRSNNQKVLKICESIHTWILRSISLSEIEIVQIGQAFSSQLWHRVRFSF